MMQFSFVSFSFVIIICIFCFLLCLSCPSAVVINIHSEMHSTMKAPQRQKQGKRNECGDNAEKFIRLKRIFHIPKMNTICCDQKIFRMRIVDVVAITTLTNPGYKIKEKRKTYQVYFDNTTLCSMFSPFVNRNKEKEEEEKKKIHSGNGYAEAFGEMMPH